MLTYVGVYGFLLTSSRRMSTMGSPAGPGSWRSRAGRARRPEPGPAGPPLAVDVLGSYLVGLPLLAVHRVVPLDEVGCSDARVTDASAGRRLDRRLEPGGRPEGRHPDQRRPGRGRRAGLFAAAGLEIDLCTTASEGEAAAVVGPSRLATGDRSWRPAATARCARSPARSSMPAAATPVPCPPLAILPLGSVMNIARSLKIPRALEAAVGVIAEAHERSIDVGEVAGWGPFFEGVAIGLHAELFAEGAALDAGDRLAPFRAIGTALRYQPSRLTLELDDGRTVRTGARDEISNGPFGDSASRSRPVPGWTTGCSTSACSNGSRAGSSCATSGRSPRAGDAYEPRVQTLRSATVSLRGASPLCVRADGEEVGMTPVELRVRAGRAAGHRPG